MTTERKLILLSNDDGIESPWLLALRVALLDVADCFVVAPMRERSASSHAITLHGRIAAEKHFIKNECIGYRVDGTPADCVKLALCELCPRKPDLVVSGINIGENVGISIYYSGTVAAAREGAFAGIPSLSLSVEAGAEESLMRYACSVGLTFARYMIEKSSEKALFLNVNIPARDIHLIRGMRVTRQARSHFQEWFTRQDESQSEQATFLLGGKMVITDEDADNDAQVVRDGYISVTPMRIDLTDHESIQTLQDVLAKEEDMI